MSAIAETFNSSPSTLPPTATASDRYLLAQVGQRTVVFPTVWVAEIVRVERSQVLDLPFYDPQILGLVHQNGGLIPLISTHRLLQLDSPVLRELFMIVRLSSATGQLANLGLIIDRALGSSSQSALPSTLFQSPTASSADMVLLNLEMFPPTLWLPQRWH